MLKRPDPSASDGKHVARPRPKPQPKAKAASEKEQEVAEALFDLANFAALGGGDKAAPAKRKRARGKKDAAGDGEDGAKAAKRETENGDALPGTVPAGVPGGFPGAAANPLQALFSTPTAMSAMASHLYGAPGAATAMRAGFPPGFDIQSVAAALGGAPPAPLPPPTARPPGALKLCAAHVYIAHFIDYQQQMSRYSLLAKPMDPAAGARGKGALAVEATVSAPPAQDPPAGAAARGGVGEQSPQWPAQTATMPPPGAAFAQGAPPGDLAQAHQLAALQALIGQSMSMGGGGMPFAFPGMPAAANPFAGMMGVGGPAGPGAADAPMPPGTAEAMAAIAAQMGQAQVYPPQAQAPPWVAPPAMPTPPAAPVAEATAAEATAAEAAPPPAEADPAPASEGVEAEAEVEAEAKADGDARTAAEVDTAEPAKEDLPAEGAAVPAPA